MKMVSVSPALPKQETRLDIAVLNNCWLASKQLLSICDDFNKKKLGKNERQRLSSCVGVKT